MTRMQQSLDNVPAARLNDEMLKMLMSGAALQCVDLMAQYKIEVHLPIFKLLMRERENVFVRKALERRAHASGKVYFPEFPLCCSPVA